MEYFEKFPTIVYNDRVIKDITIRLDFIKRIKDNISIFQYKILRDNERPEDVASEIYNDPTLYWIVLYMNDIVDPFYDWLLSEKHLIEYCTRKYDNINAVHHYETIEGSDLGIGVWVNFGTPFSKSITNYQYEYSLNEEKRKVKILKSRYVAQVLAEYKRELDAQET